MIKSIEGQFQVNSEHKDCNDFDKTVAAGLAHGIAKMIVEKFSDYIQITEEDGKLNYKLSLYAFAKSELDISNQ